MAVYNSSRSGSNDSFVRTGLHGLVSADSLHSFNPTPLGYYRTVSGDTLSGIASLFYGINWRDMWRVIGAENNIDNDNPLAANIVLTIPQPGWRIL